MHMTEVQRHLDTAKIWKELVNIKFWESSTGDCITMEGWLVIGSHWRGGTHNLRNPKNGQIRKVRDINIYEFNNHPVYV